jgi:hypothetical protein
MAQYAYYVDPDTGLKVRDGAETTNGSGAYVLDMELTPLGFDGVQSVDEGVTGDWIRKEEIHAT